MRDTPRRDLHAEITAKIIAAVHADRPSANALAAFRQTSLDAGKCLTRARYNGINVIALWAAAELRGFTSPVWATYKQYRDMGAQVRKGAKAELVVFYKDYAVEPDPSNESDDGKRRVARASWCSQRGGRRRVRAA